MILYRFGPSRLSPSLTTWQVRHALLNIICPVSSCAAAALASRTLTAVSGKPSHERDLIWFCSALGRRNDDDQDGDEADAHHVPQCFEHRATEARREHSRQRQLCVPLSQRHHRAPNSVSVDEHHDRDHGQDRDGECTPDPLHEVLGRVVAVSATNSLLAFRFSEDEQQRAVEDDQEERNGVEGVHAKETIESRCRFLSPGSAGAISVACLRRRLNSIASIWSVASRNSSS